MSTRREFLNEVTALTGLTAAASLAMLPDSLFGPETAAALQPDARRRMPEPAHSSEFTLPPLPYPPDALEPFIDTETMRIHHGRHHAAYVAGLNAALKGLREARMSNDYSNIQQLSRLLAFHAGGYYNHIIFWNNMAPAGKGDAQPDSPLSRALARDFGSPAKFRAHFSAAAAAVEGNGWAVLGYHPALRRLLVMTLMNQQDLATVGLVPLLMCDVWEHAYYLKYQNRRVDYISEWWNVVNWRDVSERYEAALSTRRGDRR